MSGRFPTAKNIKVEDLIARYEEIIPDVDEELKKRAISDGQPFPETPDEVDGLVTYGDNGDPLFSEDITGLNDVVVGKMFWFFTNWCNYVQAELTRGRCVLLVLERNAKVVTAALTIYYKEEQGLPANQADDRVVVDERYVEMDRAVLRAKVFVEKTDTRYDQLKRILTNISREQTRRAEENDRNRHEAASKPAWPRRPRR